MLWLPTYREIRQLLRVWPGRSRALIVGLHRTLRQLSGPRGNPNDWKDPDTWIQERLSGEDLELARAIWADTNKTVNPRYTRHAWSACQQFGLLAEDADGVLELTDRGREFVENEFGETEAFLDRREGLIELLAIVSDHGPPSPGTFYDPWAAYLEQHSRILAESSIRATLRDRLNNLLDRNLINREGRTYSITEDGRDYLAKVGETGASKVPAGIRRYADDEDGRTILAAFADSVEFAHSLDPQCWVTLIDRRRRDLRLYVGSTLMMVLEATRERIELTLLSGNMEDEQRDKVRSAQVLREYTYPEGAKRYLLTWSDFIEHWESLRTVHRETMRPVVMKAPRSRRHRTDAIDFLNEILGRELPQPGYVGPTNPNGSGDGGFRALTQSPPRTPASCSPANSSPTTSSPSRPSASPSSRGSPAPARPGSPWRWRGTSGPPTLRTVPSSKSPSPTTSSSPSAPTGSTTAVLLGYLNPLTYKYSTTPFLDLLLRARDEENRAAEAGEKPHPFFVILDEMNLARVEHYFSDFLSALESGEDIPLHEDEAVESGKSGSGPRVPRKLKVPGNVLFTGTVNVDETTYMFSPKVLDRAFTIEFDRVDLEGFTKGPGTDDASGLNLDGIHDSLDLLPSGRSDDDWKPSRADWVEFSEKTGPHQKALLRLHDILETRHRHFGYRVANEIARFVNLARRQAKDVDAAVDAAFDLALLQKVLPKFHGTQHELESLLKEILQFAVLGGGHIAKKDQKVELDDWKVVEGRLVRGTKTGATSQPPAADAGTDVDEEDSDNPDSADPGPKPPAYPRTGAKVLRMLTRLRDRGFTSFIE